MLTSGELAAATDSNMQYPDPEPALIAALHDLFVGIVPLDLVPEPGDAADVLIQPFDNVVEGDHSPRPHEGTVVPKVGAHAFVRVVSVDEEEVDRLTLELAANA